MADFNLQQTLQVNNYTVEIYTVNNETIDANSISEALSTLNETSMPNHLVEVLEAIAGVSKIRVLDSNGNLLVNSEKYIP